MKCPRCGKVDEAQRVIYYGLPFYFCSDESCNTLWGCRLWDWIASVLPFNGVFMTYEGSYWAALWFWMFHG